MMLTYNPTYFGTFSSQPCSSRLAAQLYMGRIYTRWSSTRNSAGLNGVQVSRQVISQAGLQPVSFERAPGSLTDHFDPPPRRCACPIRWACKLLWLRWPWPHTSWGTSSNTRPARSHRHAQFSTARLAVQPGPLLPFPHARHHLPIHGPALDRYLLLRPDGTLQRS